MIPQELNITITKALDMNRELKNLYESDERVKKLIDMCVASGRAAEAYVHACSRCCDQSDCRSWSMCRCPVRRMVC